MIHSSCCLKNCASILSHISAISTFADSSIFVQTYSDSTKKLVRRIVFLSSRTLRDTQIIFQRQTQFLMIILISSLREFVTGNLPRPTRDTLPAQREYHVRVTRPKHRVSRPPPEASLTYIPRTRCPTTTKNQRPSYSSSLLMRFKSCRLHQEAHTQQNHSSKHQTSNKTRGIKAVLTHGCKV
jgi:hypothetical protein